MLGASVLRAVGYLLTEGLFGIGPRSSVAVVERTSGREVMRHSWGKDSDSASRDVRAIEDALSTMTVEDFAHEYSLDWPETSDH